MEATSDTSRKDSFACAHKLSYAVVSGTKVKRILRGISFSLDLGDMCVILGPSGAGKSSLLDLIAQRNMDGIWSGDIAIGGKSIQAANKAHGIAYVYQSDLLIATLTVEETVRYSTWLHLSSSLSDFEKESRVQSIVSQLGLARVKHSKVYDEVKQCGLSGGERKRLSIATQIVADPHFILLDEPTSGLDSALAMEVMSAVRKFCANDRVVLTTIHQPSRSVYALFDKLMVIVHGRLVYFGTPADAMTHFTSPALGFSMGTNYQNPAEFILDICHGSLHQGNSPSRVQVQDLVNAFDNSTYYRATAAAVGAEMSRIRSAMTGSTKDDRTGATPGSAPSESARTNWSWSLFGLTSLTGTEGEGGAPAVPPCARSTLSQSLILLHRTFISKIRDKTDLYSHIIKNVSISILWGLIFFQKGDPSGPFYSNGYAESKVQTLNSLLLQPTVFAAFTSLSVVGSLAQSAALYQRESGSRSYSPLAYAVSQAISSIPVQLLTIFVLIFGMYFLAGLPPSGAYFFFLLLSTVLAVYFSFAMTMTVTVWVGDIGLVYMIIPVQADIMISLSGYAPQIGDMPVVYNWLSYLNYARWQFESLMINHWQRYDTDDGTGDDKDGNGDVLNDYGFDDMNKFDCLWIIVAFTVVMLFIFYLGVLPAKSKLQKVSNAEDARAVLDRISATQSRSPSILNEFFSPTPSASPSPLVLSPSPSASSLKEKLIVSDPSQLVHEEPPVLIPPPNLSVHSFSLSNTEADLSEGCCLVFRSVCAPAMFTPSGAAATDSSGADDSGDDSISTLSDPSDPGKRPVLPAGPSSASPTAPKVAFVQNVCGVIYPGEMCAIMGSSGAGKTSLLNILSQRKNAADYSGKVYYNGVLGVMPPFGYVTQEDVHMDVMTVQESLEFAGELRLPEGMPKEEKQRRVKRVLALLLLENVANSIVGGEHKHGISGGELKRLSIGVELLHFPGLMFLDEPTTGLDSSTSLGVLSALRNLANQHRTIVMTLHQPSEDMFQLFDRVMIMSQSRVVYFGPVQQCTDFYTQSPYEFEFSARMDAAEYMIAAAGSFIPAADGRTITAGELAAYYASSKLCTTVREAVRALEKSYTRADLAKQAVDIAAAAASGGSSAISPDKSDPNHSNPGDSPVPHLSFRRQLDVLLGRRVLIMRRNWKRYAWNAVKEVFLALVVGTIWLQIGTGSSEHVYNDRFSVINKTVVYITARNMDPMPVFEDRRFHYRERALNAYSPLAYWLSIWLPQVPVLISYGLIFSCIVYPLSGLRAGARYFLTYQYFSIMADIVAYFMFSVVAALCPSPFSALHYLPLLQMTLIIMSGFSQYLPNMQVWIKTMTYGVVTRYIFQGLVLNELQDNGNLPEWHRYIVELGFTGISVGGCAAMMLVFVAASMFAYYLALKYVNFERR